MSTLVYHVTINRKQVPSERGPTPLAIDAAHAVEIHRARLLAFSLGDDHAGLDFEAVRLSC